MAGSIICGVDDSSEARAAARVARDLVERLGTRLILVSVSAPLAFVAPAGRTARAEGALHEERYARAEAIIDAVAREVGVHDAEHLITPGDPADRLIQAACDEGAVLIVVGSRGQGSVKSALLGSVSAAVLREARCPVVIVPAGATE